MSFLLDTNTYIDAQNRYYANDIVPGFWSVLEEEHDSGRLQSIIAVREEILVGDDFVADWARPHKGWFHHIDASSMDAYPILLDWVDNHPNFRSYAVKEFLDQNADFQLIAYAYAHKLTVVTNERSAPNARNRIKIPDVCHDLGIQVINTFDMLREIEASFR